MSAKAFELEKTKQKLINVTKLVKNTFVRQKMSEKRLKVKE